MVFVTQSDTECLVRRLVSGDPAAVAAVVDAARTSTDPVVLAAAALWATHPHELLATAGEHAHETRERQIVAVVAAYVARDFGRVDDLAREHLVDHPDSVLVSWIAAEARSAADAASSPHSPTETLEMP